MVLRKLVKKNITESIKMFRYFGSIFFRGSEQVSEDEIQKVDLSGKSFDELKEELAGLIAGFMHLEPEDRLEKEEVSFDDHQDSLKDILTTYLMECRKQNNKKDLYPRIFPNLLEDKNWKKDLYCKNFIPFISKIHPFWKKDWSENTEEKTATVTKNDVEASSKELQAMLDDLDKELVEKRIEEDKKIKQIELEERSKKIDSPTLSSVASLVVKTFPLSVSESLVSSCETMDRYITSIGSSLSDAVNPVNSEIGRKILLSQFGIFNYDSLFNIETYENELDSKKKLLFYALHKNFKNNENTTFNSCLGKDNEKYFEGMFVEATEGDKITTLVVKEKDRTEEVELSGGRFVQFQPPSRREVFSINIKNINKEESLKFANKGYKKCFLESIRSASEKNPKYLDPFYDELARLSYTKRPFEDPEGYLMTSSTTYSRSSTSLSDMEYELVKLDK